jgi:hypothetical protein
MKNSQKDKNRNANGDSNDKKKSFLETINDPDRMTVINLGMFLVFGIVLFYFGWGLEWITERHITQWLRTVYKNNKRM